MESVEQFARTPLSEMETLTLSGADGSKKQRGAAVGTPQPDPPNPKSTGKGRDGRGEQRWGKGE